ncbi:Hypothetical predicted protein [Podarcis lilfordi]|uniref:Uncharacterized protein n=1 Tax=Podarcis lilfordi TaxID=74358 RepID=A0AA35LCS0_9SAUR|nr:Hypothetical predicted protein [Podarcis lilfordi]
MMNKREILDTILQHLQPPPQKTSKPGHKKNALYRYYGHKLRDSRSIETVHQYLHLLLALPLKEETDREGISEAIGVAQCGISATQPLQGRLRCLRILARRMPVSPSSFAVNTRKNQALKKSFMKAATLTTKALVQSNVGHVTFPHKEELTFCIIDYYQETIDTCLNMLTSLLSEAPSLETLQEILVGQHLPSSSLPGLRLFSRNSQR